MEKAAIVWLHLYTILKMTKQMSGCQGLGAVRVEEGVGVTIKGQHEVGLCGDGIVIMVMVKRISPCHKLAEDETHASYQRHFPGLDIVLGTLGETG